MAIGVLSNSNVYATTKNKCNEMDEYVPIKHNYNEIDDESVTSKHNNYNELDEYATTKHNNYNEFDEYATIKHDYIEFHPERFQVNKLIKLQNERLRISVQEYRRQQMITLLKNEELHFSYILAQKDEQIRKVANINLELEECVAELERDNQLWRKIVHESESMVLSLDNDLEHIKRKSSYYSEDMESCCDMNVLEEETAENDIECHHHEITTSLYMICKCCHLNESTFLFLPCRHICSCKSCEHSLEACPVCSMEKNTSIEILYF